MESSGGRGRPGGMDLRPEHFDGHSEFASMTAEQRLLWLSEIAKFVLYVREHRCQIGELRALD